MSDVDNDQVSWHERLMLACSYNAESIEEEQERIRKVALSAPFDALELFLSSPPGKYEGPARAVMAQVYENRASQARSEIAKREGRAEWWRGLVQQISAQLIGSLLLGLILGFIGGVWFCSA
ncbi:MULTISPECIES: hypothetical protein [Alcanivorax]|nr:MULTISPECIES: hypothetical protein [Alcanivorax]